jgi:hypothetical protein
MSGDEIRTKRLARLLREGPLDQAKSFAQGMSNAAASNVSGPVDALAWLLRKTGLPIPQNPMGGSEWMAEKGLTAAPNNRLAGLLGEGAGLSAPIAAFAKAPQIAGGLLALDDHAMEMGRRGVENYMDSTGMRLNMIRTPNGRIPETSKEIDAFAEQLLNKGDALGYRVNSGASNVSGSRYVTFPRGDDLGDLQVRISNHGDRYSNQLAGTGERFSVDPDSGNTFEMAKQWLKESGVNLGARVKPKPPQPSLWSGVKASEVNALRRQHGGPLLTKDEVAKLGLVDDIF